ncbi:putative maltose O-acetyltransferase [Hypsibius exemplaris]|uniref:Maltose O-acetyltransferase n=1 Tax=Hypsibius exemplaris TaxID=2072580 RepID=A0A1W0WX41_HYPEX|nr:putative maltose O-acetyltransferase [Hypsibius exemplaris]
MSAIPSVCTVKNEDEPTSYVCIPDADKIQSIKLAIPAIIPSPPVTQMDKLLSGELYDAREQVLVDGRAFARVCCQKFNASDPLDVNARNQFTEELLGTKGKGVWIEPPFNCEYGSNLHLGDATYLNFNCLILDDMPVRIGARCFLAPNVSIYTATHPIEPRARSISEYSKPVTIGDDCWIGGCSVILPGVTIGDCSVVGAGSVVTKNVPPYTVVAGNPAKKIKDVPRVSSDVPVVPSK